jgi:hypothetical protein
LKNSLFWGKKFITDSGRFLAPERGVIIPPQPRFAIFPWRGVAGGGGKMVNWKDRAREWKLDPLVEDLVILLNKYGIKTIESCQGHLAGKEGKVGFHPPYISFLPPSYGLLRVLVHSVSYCCNYPTNINWVITAHEWYTQLQFFLEPAWALLSEEVSKEMLMRTQDDFKSLYESLKFHLEAYKEGRFETLLRECMDKLLEQLGNKNIT